MRWLTRTDRRAPGRRTAGKRPAGRRATLRRLPSRWTLRNWRRVGLGTGAAVALGGALLLWQSGWIGRQVDAAVTAAYALSADAGLAVDDVLVEGRERTEAESILAALDVERGTPILAVDPRAAKARIEDLPWVREAAVERRLPRLLYVRLTERRPFALWQLDGRLSVIDEGGRVIPGAAPESFVGLPLVVGEDAPEHAAALLDVLDAEPALKRLVVAAVRVGGRRWNLRLEGGIDVRLPELDPAEAWAELARMERRHGVLERNVVTIDLRLPDRLVVRTAPGAAPKTGRAAGKNT